jgi:hypothetical protein
MDKDTAWLLSVIETYPYEGNVALHEAAAKLKEKPTVVFATTGYCDTKHPDRYLHAETALCINWKQIKEKKS